MRRSITRAFLATSAAATITTLGLAVAGSAGAATVGPSVGAAHRVFAPSGGPPIYTPSCSKAVGFSSISPTSVIDTGGCAGYVGSGRDFRYAQALITIPTFTAPRGAIDGADTDAPTLDVGLSSNGATAVAGLMSCLVYENVIGPNPCGGSGTPGWVAFGLFIWNNGSNMTVENFPFTQGATAGAGVFFSIYYNQPGNSLHFNITFDPTSTSPTTHSFAMDAHGAMFNHAAALVDYSACTSSAPTSVRAQAPNCTPSAPVPGPAPDTDVRITQFFRGAFTTANGQRGTFAGPWTMNPVIITSRGDPPPGNQLQVEAGVPVERRHGQRLG